MRTNEQILCDKMHKINDFTYCDKEEKIYYFYIFKIC